MPIEAPAPYVVPATAQKTYPHLWIYNLVVHAPAVDAGRIAVEVLPYNDDANEIAPGAPVTTISTDQLWQAVAAVPEVAQAFGAVMAAIPALQAWIAARNQEEQP